MKDLKLMCALGGALLGPLVAGYTSVHGAQSVVTTLNNLPASGGVPACHTPLTVKLTISDLAAAGCPITFNAVPGCVITPPTSAGYANGINPSDVQVLVDNSFAPPSLTVNNVSGTPLSGTIEFDVDLTGCALFPPDLTTTPSAITFPTTSACGTVVDAAPLDVDVPIIQLVKNPLTFSSRDNEPLLMNEEVKRFYKLEAARGIVDFFTLDINPEPHITITTIDAYNPITAQWITLYTALAPAPISLVFRSTSVGNDIDIASLGPNGANHYLQPGNYVLFRETLKVTGCTDPADLPTSYKASIWCDEDKTAPFPCWRSPMTLNVDCLQKNTRLDLKISDNANYSQPPGFPSISVCDPNAQGIDYVLFINNTVLAGPLSPSGAVPPVGAGVRALDSLRLYLNGGYFAFDAIYIGGTALPPACYSKSGPTVGNPTIGVSIDFKKFNSPAFLADPDGPGGLTDRVGNPNDPGVYCLGTSGIWNLLPEGEHVTIVLKNFRFIGQAKFRQCGLSDYTLDNGYLWPNGWDMCRMKDGYMNTPSFALAPNGYYFENLWKAANKFAGSSFSASDVTDIAPQTQGQAESANLTFRYISISGAKIGGKDLTPFTISQNNGLPELIKCLNVRYQAWVTIAPGFKISDNGATLNAVTIADPLNPLFVPVTVSAVPVANSTQWYVDYTGNAGLPFSDGHGHNLTHPAQAQLTFNVAIDCSYLASLDPPVLFGFQTFPMEFRALCEPVACEGVYRVFSCTDVEIFFHCPGVCDPAPPVGTSNFSCKRITPGWLNEAAFAADQSPLPSVDPQFADRVYECDLIEARSTMGYANNIPQGGILAFEIAYDPPPGGSSPLLANLLHPEPPIGGLHKVNFTLTPQNGTPGPPFTIPMASWQFKVLPEKDVVRIYADVSVTPPGQQLTAEKLLQTGNYRAEFVGQFRVKDNNSLLPTYHDIDQLRGGFIVVDNTVQRPVLAFSCDDWGTRLTLLKTIFSLEQGKAGQFIAPHYNVQNDNLFPIDQCYLRYVVFASASGGFPTGVDFSTEFRPMFDFPDYIRFNVPNDYEFLSIDYAEGNQGMGAWNPLTLDVVVTPVASGATVELNNIHHNYPSFRSVQKVAKGARQALRLTLIRKCPLQFADGPPIEVADLRIKTRAYATDAACSDSLLWPSPQNPAIPKVVKYEPGASEQNILKVTTDALTVAYVNPIKLPLQLAHSGGGNTLSNVWMYFTVRSGRVKVNGITPTLGFGPNINGVFGPTVSGLYQVGVVNTRSGFVTIDYECSHEKSGNPSVLDPIDIDVHVGNNCFGYPNLDVVSGTFDVQPCFVERVFSFTIQPKKSLIAVEVDSGTVGECGNVEFNVLANSDGANATDVLLNVTPPPGYTLDPSQCSMGPSLSAPVPAGMLASGLLDVSALLLAPFGQSYFAFDTFLTAGLYNPLKFRLVYLPNCHTPSGLHDFKFSIAGKGSCGENLVPNQVLRPISYSVHPSITLFPANMVVPCAEDVPAADDTAVQAVGSCLGVVAITHEPDVITPAYEFLSVSINGSSGRFTSPNGINYITALSAGGPFIDSINGNNTVQLSQFPNLFGPSGLVEGYKTKVALNGSYTVTFDLQNYVVTPGTMFGLGNIAEGSGLYKIEVYANCGSTPTVIAPPFTSHFKPLGWDDDVLSGNIGWHHLTLDPVTGNLATSAFKPSGTGSDAAFWDSIPPTACKIVVTGNLGPSDDVVFYFAEPKPCANRYTITRTYHATDACLNVKSQSQTITVDDQTPPVTTTLAGAGDVTLPCQDTAGIAAALAFVPSFTDNCTLALTVSVPDANLAVPTDVTRIDPLCPQGYVRVRKWSANDGCGNTSLPYVQTITVHDAIAPVPISPVDVTVQCDLDVPAPNPASVAVTDNCDAAPVVVHLGDVTSGTCPKSIVRTYKATDACGNASTCTQTITVQAETIAPVLTGPADLTVQRDADVPVPNVAAVTVTDNCAPAPVVMHVSDVASGNCPKTITRTYQATDACGNIGTCTQTITVHSTMLCSFTQGFYGNANGKFNGTPSLTLVGNLLAQGPLLVGKIGLHSLSIQPGDAALLQQRMPSGGQAVTLPMSSVDQTLQTAVLPWSSKSPFKFRNILLGQTIALSLSARLSPALLCLDIAPSFCTQTVLPGLDGLKGTSDDLLITGTIEMFNVQNSVFTALADPGLGINNSTVQGLLRLANRALAGEPIGAATLSDISDAVDAINRGFDECRVLVDCTSGMIIQDSFNDSFTSSPPLGGGGGGGGGLAADGLGSPQALIAVEAGEPGNVRARVANRHASKEPGEPDHAGNAGGKSVWWRWRAPSSGPVLLETEGSSFDTLLAVYTGADLMNLVPVASNDDTVDGVFAEVAFQAVAGTEYRIVVDAFDGESGGIVLSLIIDYPHLCLPLVRTGSQVDVCVDGQLGRIYTVETSTDLTNWTPVVSLLNTDGVLRFTDPKASDASQRFYRLIAEFD